mmetsp:Transcript_18010/g.37353  ORF Transcript_18010/g.37353 Transcript_18010/m.37353 type:complete len:84 (+) Transcript_18010:537-788(+)
MSTRVGTLEPGDEVGPMLRQAIHMGNILPSLTGFTTQLSANHLEYDTIQTSCNLKTRFIPPREWKDSTRAGYQTPGPRVGSQK